MFLSLRCVSNTVYILLKGCLAEINKCPDFLQRKRVSSGCGPSRDSGFICYYIDLRFLDGVWDFDSPVLLSNHITEYINKGGVSARGVFVVTFNFFQTLNMSYTMSCLFKTEIWNPPVFYFLCYARSKWVG